MDHINNKMKTIHIKLFKPSIEITVYVFYCVCMCVLCFLCFQFDSHNRRREEKKITSKHWKSIISCIYSPKQLHEIQTDILVLFGVYTVVCDSVLDRTLSRTKDIQIIFVGFKTIYYYSTTSRIKVYRIFRHKKIINKQSGLNSLCVLLPTTAVERE